ncbi:MAG: nucleotidyltransferase domain-containing protein [Acidimicrobiaceae bacterium]|nr:nucleotidyltransferase domain-containing protein [Acidimicrobiaceae bacterium]MXZ66093.1 nucleotidyltransferase domain-containing protein [Acidimicrobiaceae bacterium]MYF33016.1 nucleotidyltransferase domain-containing protein [Acidimicrobiaceae bacterium]MYG79671.1 nucleotidyltransferase domain-containing protein [Acidimicrobiaceae bacterium]MYJ28667.1 nucleotidyltransferase domain-containing protein [Acidimicrobiaceae bacterium]
MTEIAAPTLEDARTAGRALTAAGAREVLAYGSVVAGGADPVSDIDLVAIFDDVDYKNRWQLRLDLMDMAGDACGHYVTVWVTDVAEWAAQNKMASSFAAAIRDDLVVVAAGQGDDRAVVWDKPQALPDTDIEAAYRHLEEVHRRLGVISPRSQQHDDPWRHCTQSEGAAAVIAEALRALGAATQTDARALYSRDIATVVAHLPGEDQTTVRARFGDRVTFDDVTMWRASRRAFGNEHRWWRMMPEADKIATAESAEALTAAAIGVVEYASDKIARLHGRHQVNDWITRDLKRLRRKASTE